MSEPTTGGEVVDLAVEQAALRRALEAVQLKLQRLAGISGGGADALADEYIDAVVRGTVEKLQHELVVFGRIDDDHAVAGRALRHRPQRRAARHRLACAVRREVLPSPLRRTPRARRRVTYVGSIVDLFIEDFASGEVSGTSPLLGELSRSRGSEMRTAVATLQSEQDELVRLDPTAKLVLRGGPGTGKTVVALHRAAWLVYNDTRLTAGRILVIGPERQVPPVRGRGAADPRRGPDHADDLRPPARTVVRRRGATSGGSTSSTASRPRSSSPDRSRSG